MPFKVGDLVKLKSGGPAMTVESKKYSNGNYRCKWFMTTRTRQVLREAFFIEDALVLCGDESAGSSKSLPTSKSDS